MSLRASTSSLAGLLGRHEQRRAGDRAFLGEAGVGGADVGERLGEAEVEQLGHVEHAAAVGDEDVRRLDVAVDEAVRVGFGQRVADLPHEVQQASRRERAVALDELAEVVAGQELHHVVKRAVGGAAVVVDVDRVPVRELGGGADFAFEAGEHAGVAGLLGADDLDGAGALHHLVLGEIDLAHAAAAEQLFEPVLAELLGDERLAAQRVDRVDADDAGHRGE